MGVLHSNELKARLQSGKLSFPKPLQERNHGFQLTRNLQDVHAQFEHLLGFVSGEKAQIATADQIEQGLFKLLIILGARLLQLFFVLRSKNCSREALLTQEGEVLRYHRETVRHYYSIFGKITFERPYFYTGKIGRALPLDEDLSIGPNGYSDLLRELSGYVDVDNVYHKTAQIFKRLLGLSLSTRDLQANMAEDALDVETYYAQKPPHQPVPYGRPDAKSQFVSLPRHRSGRAVTAATACNEIMRVAG